LLHSAKGEYMDDLDGVDEEALWLAACLADESTRPDRVIADPFAAHLAGTRGARLLAARSINDGALMTALSVAVVDDMIQHAVLDQHLHAVVQLGAGLDTRPFRVALPNDLRWVELDSNTLCLYKGMRLAHLTPQCRVERMGFDMTDPAQPGAVVRRAVRGVARGLLVTENALDRFSSSELSDLALQLGRGIKWWILSTSSHATGDPELIDHICKSRWRVVDCRPVDHEARRLVPDRVKSTAHLRNRPSGTIWLLRRVR
jgi:hypothetical protein